MNNYAYEEQTQRLLAETQSELTNIGNQLAGLQRKWETLKKEAEAYETVLQGYLRRTGKHEVAKPEWAKLLKGLTHKQKLTTIAKQSGGRIRVNQATDILYTSKLTEAKKRATAYSMVQLYLADMAEDGEFQKVAPGEYELLGAQQSLLKQ